jgi:uncharacterized protein YpmB
MIMKSLAKWIGISIISIAVLVIGLLYYVLVLKPEQEVRNNLLKENPQITKVYSIENVRGWGEGPEYSAIVKIDGEKCRIWTFGDGVITDNECEWDIK